MTLSLRRICTKANLLLLGAVAAAASMMAFVAAQNLCFYWFHQPVMPQQVMDLKK